MNDSLRCPVTSRVPRVSLVGALAVTFAACGGREDLGSNDESSIDSNLDAGGRSSGDAALSTADTGTPVAKTCVATSRRGTVAIDSSGDEGCGIAADGTIACWGVTDELITLPTGTFTEIDFSGALCGVRTTGEIACEDGVAPPGGSDFVRVVSDESTERVCGLTSAGGVRCTAGNGVAALSLPGPYLDIATNDDAVCTLRADGTPVCTGYNGKTVLTPRGPLQTLQLIVLAADSAGQVANSCGLTASGAPTCTSFTLPSLVSFSFDEVSFEASQDESGGPLTASYCGISAGCGLSCNRFEGTALAVPSGSFEHVALSMALGWLPQTPFACATDASGHITCFMLDGAGGTAPISPPADMTFQF